MNVEHTCKVIYGSYSGEIKIICDENDGMESIKAKIRKKADLTFLSMATYQVKIISTNYLPY